MRKRGLGCGTASRDHRDAGRQRRLEFEAARRMCQSLVTRRTERTLSRGDPARGLARVAAGVERRASRASRSSPSCACGTSYSAANSRGFTSGSTPVTSIRRAQPCASTSSPRSIRPRRRSARRSRRSSPAPSGCGRTQREPQEARAPTPAPASAARRRTCRRITGSASARAAPSAARSASPARRRRPGSAPSSSPVDPAEPAAADHARAERGELAAEQQRPRSAPAPARASPPTAASTAIERWNMRAIWRSVPPSRWTISIVSRLAAERAARRQQHRRRAGHAPAARPAPARAICSDAIAPNTGSSQPACASTRADGRDRGERARAVRRSRAGGDRPVQPRVDQRRDRHRVVGRRRPPRRRPATVRAARRAPRRARSAPATSSRFASSAQRDARPGARARPARPRRSARSARPRSRHCACRGQVAQREPRRRRRSRSARS